MRNRHWAIALFVAASFLAGLMFWWSADWWAYVDMTDIGRGMVPKFKAAPAEQFVVSAAVGMFLSGAVTALVVAVCKAWRRLVGRPPVQNGVTR